MRWLMAVVLSCTSFGAAYGQCSPEQVLKIVTVDASPDIQGSFAAAPKTLYRLGTRFARIEETPDVANKIHGLIVVSEPDSWIVNLRDHTGQHVVDPDRNGIVRTPVFVPGAFGASFPEILHDLELGCEVQFFTRHKAPVSSFNSPEGPMVRQSLGAGGWTSVLLRKDETAQPAILFLFHGDEVVKVLKYLEYRQVSDDPSKLFERPGGIAFTDAGGA